MKDLFAREYRTITSVKGPLIFLRNAQNSSLGDFVDIKLDEKTTRHGQVIELSEEFAVIQIFGENDRINPSTTTVKFREEGVKLSVSPYILGRIFSGSGQPMDGMEPIAPRKRKSIQGEAINPVRRDMPVDFIQTGISAIDGMNTLVRGQKLPIFSGSGLPANEIASQIIKYAKVSKQDEKFALVFAGMGITSREADFFLKTFEN